MVVGSWGKVAGVVAGLALLGGALLPVAAASAAETVRTDVILCKPSAYVSMVVPIDWKVDVSAVQVSKSGVKRAKGVVKARMSATATVTNAGTYEITGEVNRCDDDGSDHEVTERVTASNSTAAAAVGVGRARTKKLAYRAAKKAAVAKVRNKGASINADATEASAREIALQRMLSKAGAPIVGPSLPPAEAQKYLEDRIFELINIQRSQNMGTWNGQPVALSPWKRLPQIEPAGRAWAKYLVDNDLPLAHPSSTAIQADGDALGCNTLPDGFPNSFGEALAGTGYPQDMEADAQSAVQRWMASPGHRAILLSPRHTYVGVASYYKADGGGVIVLRPASADCSNITGY